ncbi:g3458 [Coccomyxa elongata]
MQTLEGVQVYIVQASVDPVNCFEHYLRVFDYSFTGKEYIYRIKLWEDNLRSYYYSNLNSHDGSFDIIDQYTVLTEAEAEADRNGNNDGPQSDFPACPDLPTPANAANPAPDSWDWRDYGVQTPVTAQSCGTCWAHAAANFVGSYLLSRNQPTAALNPLVTVSPQPLIDCSPPSQIVNGKELYVHSPDPCDGGGTINSVKFMGLAAFPLTNNQSFPYVDNSPPDVPPVNRQNPLCNGYPADVSPQYYVPSTINYRSCCLTENQLKQAIYDTGPIVVSMSCGDIDTKLPGPGGYTGRSEPYCNTTNRNTGGQLPAGQLSFNHGMLVVGYRTTAPGQGYFILKNSWGMFWNNLGYGNWAFSANQDKLFQSTCGISDQVLVPGSKALHLA